VRLSVPQELLSETSRLGYIYVINFQDNYKNHQAISLIPIQVYLKYYPEW